jgi:hypothetical protein
VRLDCTLAAAAAARQLLCYPLYASTGIAVIVCLLLLLLQYLLATAALLPHT